eukprot:1411012-Pyramimonas_sp.AAC.1
MPSDPAPSHTLPTLSEIQHACRQTKRAAPGCDGFTGALARAFATELAALRCPLQLKTAVTRIEPIQWKGMISRFAEVHQSRPQCLRQLPLYTGALTAWRGIPKMLANT